MTNLQLMIIRDAQQRLESEYDIFVYGGILVFQDDIPSDRVIKENGYEGAVDRVLRIMLDTDEVKYLRNA